MLMRMLAAPQLRLTPEQRTALDSWTAAAPCSTVAGNELGSS
jgi:hypothetical protein